uniref:cysteine-rich receptor-like protein kinase 2 isoform X2 n=1 Tax=Erigeron canadensis TaxID=72917 RepID=UPI001CB8A32A|nr:cysteine-rich receptor-like protein kinase 2 isoform X2 [Erigeron canadensis]
MGLLVVLLVLLFVKTGTSQSNGYINYTNNLIQPFCGSNPPNSLPNFIKNRNSTLDQLRMQLVRTNQLYARAQDLSAGESVFGVAQCWNYLSVEQCVACFDAGVSTLVSCRPVYTGAYALMDNCFVRYEDFNDFYNNPYVTQNWVGTPYSSCGNQSSRAVSTYKEIVDKFLSDIADVTPKISKFYVASARQITSENVTVYAVAQCMENINQTLCKACMKKAYEKLNGCLPSTKGMFFDMGCFARYSETPFFNDNQTIDFTKILKGHSSKVFLIVGAVGGVLFLLIFVFWLLHRQWKKAKSEQADLQGAINNNYKNKSSWIKWKTPCLGRRKSSVRYSPRIGTVVVNYNYKDLQVATNNFNNEYILGKGGFGEVFKAILDDNSIVAVKRLHVQHARAKEEYENEVKLISNVHHRNLLRLLGWSSQGSDLLLVLEYMPNGSLDTFLWGAKRGTLNWTQRHEIIFGIARGLAHLHNEFHVKIIHRDIKSSNILLTDDFKPKIADFGLARFQPNGESHVSTKFAGTLGYTAPEYAQYGTLSDKVDIYSFGIVTLEIIGGQKSTEVKSDQQSTDCLMEHAWKLYEKKIHINFIDETLDLNHHEKKHVIKIIEIALLCTQSASKRPTMTEVVLMLQEGQSLGKRKLTRPTFVTNTDRRIHIGSSKNSIGIENAYKKHTN